MMCETVTQNTNSVSVLLAFAPLISKMQQSLRHKFQMSSHERRKGLGEGGIKDAKTIYIHLRHTSTVYNSI